MPGDGAELTTRKSATMRRPGHDEPVVAWQRRGHARPGDADHQGRGGEGHG